MADDAAPPSDKPEWAPRMWQGCTLGAWFRLLWRNRFAVHPAFWHIIVVDTFVCFTHSFLRLVQTIRFGRAITRTPLAGPPIFIIGHWRTGTTLLHELMVQDPRFGFPTTYECLDPNHFLLTESIFSRWFQFLIPKHRPMDRMKVGFDRPQEDEFAMCMLGLPSPYLTVAFPNRPPQDQEYLDPAGMPPRALARWKRGFLDFLKTVTFKQGKRLVLKSPPHTARIKVLSEMFPDALFVHIVRDPYVVFPSNVKLWKTLYETHGFQNPTFAGLEDFVYETYLKMHERLEEGRRLLGPGRICDVHYEDLVANPEATIRSVYERLNLGGWEEMQPRLAEFTATLRGYETNKYELSMEQREEIRRRWGRVAERYGYEMREPSRRPVAVGQGSSATGE